MMKVGILGGGQLGRMLLQAAVNYPVNTFVLENDALCPAAHLCDEFTLGNIMDFDAVYNFGKRLDALTIEIESVNAEALEQLQSEGVQIFPSANALRIIKNKINQKQFYKVNELPTPDFVMTEKREDLYAHADFLPAVHKLAMGGYDGKGVQIIRSREQMSLGFDAPSVLEKMVDIRKEIAVIVAIGKDGLSVCYPPVDMVFDPKLNLLDYQVSPADLPEQTMWKIQAIALKLVKALDSAGLFAVEMFIDKHGDVLVNETAPRVHNSGHHTIEGSYSSQFDMLWRVILGYPLGNTREIMPAALVNLLGDDDQFGEARYEGLDEVLRMDNTFVHIYGKKETKPGRKMGHVTILGQSRQDLVRCASKIKERLRVMGNSQQ